MIICNHYIMYKITKHFYTDKGTFKIPLKHLYLKVFERYKGTFFSILKV